MNTAQLSLLRPLPYRRLNRRTWRDTWPMVTSACADCGVGTCSIGEWYIVRDTVWELAWASRRKSWHGKAPGTEILCLGCLERRLDRTLTADDFEPGVPVNDPNKRNASPRLRDRLTATESRGL